MTSCRQTLIGQAMVFLAAALLAPARLALSLPALPVIPDKTFNVVAFGATGDGVADNTTNIQAALNAARASGGGAVVFPAGTFLSGPLTLPSRINLHLDPGARLTMLPLGRYPGGRTRNQTFITADRQSDLEISGGGVIDGQGAAWWTEFRTDRSLVRPMLLNFYSCNRLFIHDVTFTSPPDHHCGVRHDSGNITLSNLTVSTSPDSPNTDGLNLAGTNILVLDCHISCGDDNIALGATGGLADALITNCVFGRGHGVSLVGVVSNLVVANCTFNGTGYGLRMKADVGDGLGQNLFFHDINMTNVEMPLLIYDYYRLARGAPKIIKLTPEQVAALPRDPAAVPLPIWRDITFSNLTASATVGAGTIWGKPAMPVSNVNFFNVNIAAPGPFNIYHARAIHFEDCRMSLKNGDKFTSYDAGITVTNTRFTTAKNESPEIEIESSIPKKQP